MAYIGLRSVDPEEKEMLDSLNISVFSMREIDDLGIKEVTIFFPIQILVFIRAYFNMHNDNGIQI